MKLWEILKEENIGKKYKHTSTNEIYTVKKSHEGNVELFNKYNGITIMTPHQIVSADFEEVCEIRTGWERVSHGVPYYYICVDGMVEDGTVFLDNTNDEFYNQCNYFSIKEKAEEVAREQLLYRKMKKFYDENDGQVDWNDDTQKKYEINYSYLNNEYKIIYTYQTRGINIVYFSSKELAQRCIDEVIIPFFKEK